MATGEKSITAFEKREIMRKLCQERDLDGVDFRVCLYLFSRLDFEEYTRIEQNEIAQVLGKRKEHISRSIRKLKAKGLIVEASPRIGRFPSYVLSARYAK